MGTFKGYLLNNLKGSTDNSFMIASSYKATPNQREEIKAYRDENTRNLTRITAEGKKTAIVFEVMPMNLTEKMAFQKFFNDATVNVAERKVQLEFWDDEKNEYRTTYFYMPDIQYPIDLYDENTIYYDKFSVNLIEY